MTCMLIGCFLLAQGNLIVSGSNDCKIKVWDADTGVCLRTLTGHDYLVRALSFDPRSGRLVSGSYDKTVKVWDLHSGKMVREFRGCHASHIFDVKFDHCRIVRYGTYFGDLAAPCQADGSMCLQYFARQEDRRA